MRTALTDNDFDNETGHETLEQVAAGEPGDRAGENARNLGVGGSVTNPPAGSPDPIGAGEISHGTGGAELTPHQCQTTTSKSACTSLSCAIFRESFSLRRR